jgi:hypothetical protein
MKLRTKISSLVLAATMAVFGFSGAQAQGGAGSIGGVSLATALSLGVVGALVMSTVNNDAGPRDTFNNPIGDDDGTSGTATGFPNAN